jgi:endogenous inhibitor of DNA gyrase (YacG/DUF329 family)
LRKHVCPHCGKPGISILKKAFLGPSTTRRCDLCGNTVSVRPTNFLIVWIPWLLVVLGSFFLQIPTLRIIVLGIFTIAVFIAKDRLVALEKR